MKRFFFSALVCLTACQVPSRVAMDGAGGRTAYNTAIQTTNGQQMLLNLVRLRYVDIPFFLDVSGVTTQFTYKTLASATVPIPGFSEDNPFLFGGELLWQDQPTISYAPLEGQAFSERLLRPIDLHTIQQLVYSGWEIDRIFRIMIQNFDELYNAPETSGPLPEHVPKYQLFNEAVDIFRYYQSRGELQLGIKFARHKTDDKEKDEDGKRETSLQLAIPDDGPKAHRLLELLPNAHRVGNRIGVSLDLGFNQSGRIGLMPRSILSCMYYLSQSVEVPDCHLECGVVKKTSGEEGECFDWCSVLSQLLTVHCSFMPPKNAYIAVKYRKYWYYIDDCDLTSKKTFVLLLQLYNLHAEERKTVGPILTLPIG